LHFAPPLVLICACNNRQRANFAETHGSRPCVWNSPRAAGFRRVPAGHPRTGNLCRRDYGFFAYPLAHFQRDCFWRGELPFWNPYNNCGVPFLAQWNTMPLYPPALIYLTLPLQWSLSFFCLLHLWFAGFGMFFLARRWTGNNFRRGVRRRGVCLQRPDAQPAHVAEPHRDVQLDAVGRARG
jgi:hypothetical protein